MVRALLIGCPAPRFGDMRRERGRVHLDAVDKLNTERKRGYRMQSLMQDLRYAFRQLRKAPGFAVIAVIVTALGLGANLGVFTLLSGILLRPLPYNRPDRIVAIELSGPMPYYSLTYANMLQLRDAAGSRMQIGASLCCNVPAG